MHHEPPWTKKLRRIVATIHPSRAMSKLIFYPIAVEQAALVQHRACETAKAMDRRLPPQPHAIEDVEHMVSGDSSRRSEEHTSELQSLMRISYAVFCLKKKTNYHT